MPDASNIYSVKIDYPVTGAFYYIGLYAAQRKLTVSTALGGAALVGADVALRVSTEVGQETFPEVTTSIPCFVIDGIDCRQQLIAFSLQPSTDPNSFLARELRRKRRFRATLCNSICSTASPTPSTPSTSRPMHETFPFQSRA